MAQEGARKPPKIGYSRPSQQIRYGPAPLASFEDMPSEDLVSLADENELNFDLNDDEALNEALGITETASGLRQDNIVSPCPTLTPVIDDPEERRSSGVSQNTLVAAEDLQRVHRLSATSTASSTAGGGGGGGGETKRKGSWTDILFRGKSRSKSPIETEGESGGSIKGKEDTASMKKKKKKGVLSIFTSHTDGNKGKKCKSPAKSKKNTPSPSHLVTNDGRVSANTLPIAKEIPKLSVTTATIENTSISCCSLGDDDNVTFNSQGNLSQSPCQSMCHEQQSPENVESPSLDRVALSDDEVSLSDTQQVLIDDKQQEAPNVTGDVKQIRRKLTKRSDSEISECQSLPEILPSRKTPKIPNEPTVNEDCLSRNASEETITEIEDSSAIAPPPPHIEIDTDDCEQTNLIASESIDLDECSLDPMSQARVLNSTGITSSVQIASKEQRAQELSALISVTRPRSTTPVSIAPLEEYLRKVSLSPDSDGQILGTKDKIKLVLPGDQFATCARGKLPRKSNPQIWLDFCEKSFSTSPNIRKKIMHWSSSEVNSPYKDNNFITDENDALKVNESKIVTCNTLSPNDAFTPVTDTPLTPVTPLDDSDPFQFGDSFDPSSFLRAKGLIIPAECNICMCKLKRETSDNITDASPTSSNDTPESPLLEAFTDPRMQENQVLLPPPKATTSNRDFPVVSSECVLDDDNNLQDDVPLISCNNCQCSCHNASRRNTITTHIQSKGDIDAANAVRSSHRRRRKSNHSASSSAASSPSSHAANSSSSGESSLNCCPIHLDSENPKTV